MLARENEGFCMRGKSGVNEMRHMSALLTVRHLIYEHSITAPNPAAQVHTGA